VGGGLKKFENHCSRARALYFVIPQSHKINTRNAQFCRLFHVPIRLYSGSRNLITLQPPYTYSKKLNVSVKSRNKCEMSGCIHIFPKAPVLNLADFFEIACGDDCTLNDPRELGEPFRS
jgi:hypothetical protein